MTRAAAYNARMPQPLLVFMRDFSEDDVRALQSLGNELAQQRWTLGTPYFIDQIEEDSRRRSQGIARRLVKRESAQCGGLEELVTDLLPLT